jgi:hypothetical protein
MSRQPKIIDPDFDINRLDPRFRRLLDGTVKDNRIACVQVFEIVKQVPITLSDAGKALDTLGIRLTHCQLGLFGYQPEKKIVQPIADPEPGLSEAIRSAAEGDVLSCRRCWELASEGGVPKMRISGICETLGIRIKPCQLGAF